MPEIQKYSLKEELREADETLQGSPSLLGMTMLTYPNYINSMRSTMFTAHLKQFLNLLKPQTPYVFTNFENIVGKNSSGYKKAKGNLIIFRKIDKFDDLLDDIKISKVFVFNEDKQEYDVIERKDCEDLTENFGYQIINDKIDSLKEGDRVTEGEVLFKSTSYDEDMNYGFGRNVTVGYTFDPFTSEDAAIASETLSKEFTSIEHEIFTIGLNNNDYMINLYGNKHNYQALPEIGQRVSDIFVVIRRLFNNQVLSDFKDSSLKEIYDSDNVYYVDKDVEVLDYTIYNNNDDLPHNTFYNQINKYLNSQKKYYQQIVDTCEEIMASGYKYTREVDYTYKRALEMLDTNKKWKDGDSVFGNIEIEVTIKRKAPLAKGCKITGRCGNKSVISEIRKDEDMPYTKDGRRVDLLLNILAIINRTTGWVLDEMFITGSSYQIRQKMKTLPTLEEKENMLFDYIKIWNEKQSENMYKKYKKKTKKEKEKYIQDAIDDGIYIHQNPMWETIPVFYRCLNARKKFPFIDMSDLYIRKWGREFKMLNKYFVGDMYIMKLKQSDRRGFSARSTGALDNKSLPTRSFKSKSHQERISSSCIRFGEYESFNFSIGILSEDIALFHALYRTSIKGRKDLIRLMFSDDGDEKYINQLDYSYTSRVTEIFNVILKNLGIGLDFVDEDDEVQTLNDDEVTEHSLNGRTYFCTDYQFFLIERIEIIREEVMENNPVLTETQLKEMIEKEMKEKMYINGPLEEELDEMEYIPSDHMYQIRKVDIEKELV